jgi:hypothetical protein
LCILRVNDESNRIRIQDPDPLVRGMDPRIQIRIHTKMSWIRSTGSGEGGGSGYVLYGDTFGGIRMKWEIRIRIKVKIQEL